MPDDDPFMAAAVAEDPFMDAALAEDPFIEEALLEGRTRQNMARIADPAARAGRSTEDFSAFSPPDRSSALEGELGILERPGGGHSSELSRTVNDPRLNDGKATNVPLLVKGQINVDDLLAGKKPTGEQDEIAIKRAAERVFGGASLPSFGSIEEAVTAAGQRTDNKPPLPDAPPTPQVPQDSVQDVIQRSVGSVGPIGQIFPEQAARAERTQAQALRGRERAIQREADRRRPTSIGMTPFVGARMANAGSAFLRAIGSGLAAVPQQVQLAGKDMADAFEARVPGLFPHTADKDVDDLILFQAGTAIEGFFDNAFPQNPELKNEFMSEILPGGAGSMASFILAAGVAGPAGAIATGASLGGAGQFKEAKAFGATDEKARQAARLGAALGITESFPVLNLLNRFNKASGGQLKRGLGSAIKEMFVGGAPEALQESLATVGGNAIAMSIYDKERDALEGVAQAGFVGGILGALSAGILQAAGRRHARIAEQMLDVDPFSAQDIAGKEKPSRKDFEGTLFQDEAGEKAAREAVAKALRDMGATEIRPTGKPEDALGFAVIPDTIKMAKGAFGRSKAFAQEWFTTRGNLPESVHKHRVARDGEVNAILTEATHVHRDYRKVVNETYGSLKKMPLDQIRAVNDVLRGDLPEAMRLPDQMMEPVIRMRNHVDALSTRMIEIGAVEGEMAATFDQNKGFYLHRSYRAHQDPKWAEKVPEEIRNNAKALIRQDYPDLSEAEVDQTINRLLFKGKKVADRPRNMIEAIGKLGSKDQAIFTRRKNIPKELRLLLGENEDPVVNYAKSVQMMAPVIANHEFLTKVRRDGLGVFLYEEPVQTEFGLVRQSPVPPNVAEMTAQISAENNPAMKPLDGLWTTPEIAKAFDRATQGSNQPEYLRAYMRANSVVKFSKTVASPQTHVRNLIGNVGFAVANGHYRFWKGKGAVELVAENLGISGAIQRVAGKIGINIELANQDQFRERIKYLQRLGVISDGARIGEFRAILNEAFNTDVDTWIDDVNARAAKRVAKKAVRGVTELYRAEDDVWKVYAFSNEQARYRKAKPDWTDEQVDVKAAENVRKTYPTYSEIPAAFRALRQFPVVGTFTSFPAEVYRTGYQTIKLGVSEMSDPDLRLIGLSRLTGIAAAAGTIPAALAIASRYYFGVSREEDEAVRQLAAPWTENSVLLHRGKDPETGNYRIIDLGYTTPYGYLYEPAMAALRGESWEEKMLGAMSRAFEPFLSEEIMFQAVREAMSNQKESGGQVYNEDAPAQDQARDYLSHILEPLNPGASVSARRIYMGFTGEVTDSGRAYNSLDEMMAVFSGHRPMQVDAARSLFHRERELNGRLRKANQILLRVVNRSSKVSPEEIAEAYAKTDVARRLIFADMSKKVRAAETLGLKRHESIGVLGTAGVKGLKAAAVLQETYLPYIPGKNFLVSKAEKVQVIGLQGADTADLVDRRAIVQRLALEAVRNRGR